MDATVGSVRPFEQFVLLSVVELDGVGETPAHSYDVTETAKGRIDDVDRPPFGGIERQEVITALSTLQEHGLLTKEQTESAVGKGRTAYALSVDADSILAELAGEATVGPYAETLQDS